MNENKETRKFYKYEMVGKRKEQIKIAKDLFQIKNTSKLFDHLLDVTINNEATIKNLSKIEQTKSFDFMQLVERIHEEEEARKIYIESISKELAEIKSTLNTLINVLKNLDFATGIKEEKHEEVLEF